MCINDLYQLSPLPSPLPSLPLSPLPSPPPLPPPQKTLHTLEVEKKDKDLTALNMMLEDAQYKQVIAQSENSTLQNQLSQKTQEIEDFQEKVRVCVCVCV